METCDNALAWLSSFHAPRVRVPPTLRLYLRGAWVKSLKAARRKVRPAADPAKAAREKVSRFTC